MNVANRYSVTLDVNKAKYTINSPIGLREGDSGTATIVATILDNGADYSGMTSAQFFAQKPDGTAVATDPATVSGNTITYKVNDNLTTASGHVVNAYFLINKSVSTESFEINIHPSITLHGPSTDYIPGLNDLTRVWQQTINEWQGKFDELKAQLENTDYSQVIKDSLNSTLDEAKEAYQGEFNSAVADVNKTVKTLQEKGVEADTEIAKLKTKQDNAETVADSLQATVDQLNKKILDINKWLDSLHDEFTAKNETYMKSMQAELTEKLANMKASSDSALNTVKGNISTAQSDIDGIDNKIVSLNQTLADVSKSVADINAPQIKADIDTVKADNTTNKNDISQLKQTATEFSSTLETVQTQVTDSAVGTNILRNARTLEGWTYYAGDSPSLGKSLEFEDIVSDGGQYRMARIFNNVDGKHSDSLSWPGKNLVLKAGQVYTMSIWSHSLGTSNQPVKLTLWFNWNKDDTYQGMDLTTTIAPNWTRYSATFTATVGGQVDEFRVIPFLEPGAAANIGGSIYLLKPKLEKGSVATDFSANPADYLGSGEVQTAITNALDKANYSTTSEVDSKVATGVGQAKTYAEQTINNIIGAAPATLDTIAELADAVTENKDGVQAINDGITKKADKTDVTALQNTVKTMITSISQDDYDALVSAGTVDPKILYVIPDA